MKTLIRLVVAGIVLAYVCDASPSQAWSTFVRIDACDKDGTPRIFRLPASKIGDFLKFMSPRLQVETVIIGVVTIPSFYQTGHGKSAFLEERLEKPPLTTCVVAEDSADDDVSRTWYRR